MVGMTVRKFIEELESGNRRVANNWTIVSFSLYGSILADFSSHNAAEHNRETSADIPTPTLGQTER
ncbi:hypothetical protein AS156_01510 [Bradyrhizobium macuxiense]|uniref:Uncharacterized protein n=2 Tax=Bradyrhizobium macuxiense TaxID=1755647 RepID=A0A109JCQ5_9BRAD|nr:hypothetical protein AS156_01510 [Bradyrhizobium macuxiense]